MEHSMPTRCPSCGAELHVKRLICNSCSTAIEGNYRLPVLARLPAEDQEFVLAFIRHSGSLKKMAKELELSYPTVRNMLNNLIARLNELQNTKSEDS